MLNYPKIALRSERELVKRLSVMAKKTEPEIAKLIKRCKSNKDNYWVDHKECSEPEKGKYVRAAYDPLRGFLKLIDSCIFAPHDKLLPPYIFGVKKKSSLMAAKSLLGYRRKRSLLEGDLQLFFEQISQEKVFTFLRKCQCSYNFSKLLSKIMCVPRGQKGMHSASLCLARGFPVSSRLAVWCNLPFFVKVHNLVQKNLKEYDPRVVFYVDDIGITAANLEDKRKLNQLYSEIRTLAEKHGLILNEKKKGIFDHTEKQEILGIDIQGKKLKPAFKIFKKEKLLRKTIAGLDGRSEECRKSKESLKGISRYKTTVKQLNTR